MPGFVAPTDLAIRPALLSDLEALTDLYNHYVLKTTVTLDVRPFSVAERRGWFDEHAATGPCRLIVAEGDGRLLGYASTRRFRPKRGYFTTVETAVYCRPDVVGRGCGSRLYTALFESLAGEDVHRLVAAICLPNAPSIQLHERLGFSLVGVFHEVGQKFGRYHDVAWYERPL